MPYPAKMTTEQIVDTAWQLVEEEGVEQLSLGRLASALGVRAPSLYKYMESKAALLKTVNERTHRLLIEALQSDLSTAPTPFERALAVSHAYRRFALGHPATYTLAYTTVEEAARPDPDEQEHDALPLQDLLAQMSDVELSLTALRGLWALIHGFVVLEIHGQMRRGGDLGATFDAVVRAYLSAWATTRE